MIGFRAAFRLEFIDPGRPGGSHAGHALEQVHALACALMRSVVASVTEPLHAIRSQLADLDAPVVAGVAGPVG